VSKWTGGQQLQRDRAILELIEVDVLKLSAAEIRLGAELCRRITACSPGADSRRGVAIEQWKRFREVKQV
jgi:hypothetical protein